MAVKDLYKTAFINVVDAKDYNQNTTVDFYRNYDVTVGNHYTRNSGIWNNAVDEKLSNCTEKLWIARVIVGYQSEPLSDGDPKSEGLATEGLTAARENYLGVMYYGDAHYSVVYAEAARDILDSELRNASNDNDEMNKTIVRRIKLAAAHEIGHQPHFLMGEAHHDEGGQMQAGGEAGFGHDTPFSPETIKRFRSIFSWRQE
jgi:hypothetical protein